MRRIVLLGLSMAMAGCAGNDDPPARSVTLVSSGLGSGVVSSSSGGLACNVSAGAHSGTCNIEVQEGTSLTLTAAPAAASRFAGWSDACTAAGSAVTCTLTVSEATQVGAAFDLVPVVLETTTLPNARAGINYSAVLQASGGAGTFTWSLASGSLPEGTALDNATGAIAGTPGTPGTFTFTVRVTSGTVSAERTLAITVDPATLALTTATLPDGVQGQPYSVTLQAVGGTPPYAWSVVAGTLPAQLQLDPITGVIAGIPTAFGATEFIVRVTAGAESAERQFTLTIAPPAIVITTTALPNARVGQAYSQQLTVTGGTGTYSWSIAAGSPPAGFRLSAAGLLSGTPTAAGTATFTVRVSSGGRTIDRTLTLVVDAGPVAITSTTLRDGVVGGDYADTLRATGGNGAFTWSLLNGTLPPGVSLQANGVIAGLPQAAGAFPFTVQVTSAGQSTSRAFTITIAAPPRIVEINCAGGTTGFAGNYPGCTPLFEVTLPGGGLAAGVTVSFSASGGSTLARSSGVTDAAGRVVAPAWRLGPAPGGQRLQAQVGPSVAIVQATATAVPASQYQVVVRFTGTAPTPAQAAAFTAAARRWSQVIVGDVPDVLAVTAAAADGCHPAINEVIDDVVIYAQVGPIDGPGGILGQAGPRLFRNSLIPPLGCMTFDEADLASIEASGTLDAVILHEMGHVLGMGGLWQSFGLVQGAGGDDPLFLGENAAVAYIGARPSAVPWTGLLEPVPLENNGGAGTRDSHWREATFGNELMTGFVAGPVNPLSAITAASLRDEGYVVNDAVSDPFTLAVALRVGKGPLLELRELPPTEPIGILGADGRVVRFVRPGDVLSRRPGAGRVELMRRGP